MRKLLVALAVVIGLSAGTFADVVDLSKVKVGQTELHVGDGQTLTGRLSVQNCPVMLDDGATVTLSGVQIDATASAGLSCHGDVTIILENVNSVSSSLSGYPGIYSHGGKTLTIMGSGSLTASGAEKAAGIGGGTYTGGNIKILSGTVTANGGDGGAGIGGGESTTVGDIFIGGGNIFAEGGNRAAGIGSGYLGVCNNIEVHSNNTFVVAHGGAQGAGIGSGSLGKVNGLISTLYGCTVEAIGGGSAAGIGSGYKGELRASPFNQFAYGIGYITAEAGSGCEYPIGSWVSGSGWGPGTAAVINPDGLNDNTQGDNISGYTRTIRWNGYLGAQDLNFPVTAVDGMTLYGTKTGYNSNGWNCKICIAPNATVELAGVAIGANTDEATRSKWAGITCLGSATLVLSGANSVTAFNKDYPAISVPVGARLTINGDGTLSATGGDRGAGIGGGYGMDCGEISIEGGTITARGGYFAAGIGGGYLGNVSYIKITDSTVDALGGMYAAGIGSGHKGTVDYIDIYHGAVVVAEGGPDNSGGGIYGSGAGIGSGREGTVGRIAINGCDIRATRGGSRPTEPPARPIGQGAGGTFTHGGIEFPQGNYTGMVDDNGATCRNIKWNGNLSELTWNGLARNGTVITGTIPSHHKVFVEAGARVTLQDAFIGGSDDMDDPHPGITCLGGNTTFIIKGYNYIRPYGTGPASIWSPDNITYDFQGGTLNVREGVFTKKKTMASLLDANISYGGAGLGAGYNMPCGDITIRGTGTLIAGGGNGAAGIGGAHGGSCGNISIQGVTVESTGGNGAAGIGSGDDDSGCGDITISGGSVIATPGGNDAEAIGGGAGSSIPVTVSTPGMRRIPRNGGSLSVEPWDGDLSVLEDYDDVMAFDGTVIRNTLETNAKVTIAGGATVTLFDATIDNESLGFEYPGLTCEGSATIILKGTNKITGGYGEGAGAPGILVPQWGYSSGAAQEFGGVPPTATLTIKVPPRDPYCCGLQKVGSLEVHGYRCGAGIGSDLEQMCGYIVVEGGSIFATGGQDGGAGIGGSAGGGYTGITIKGGFVTAEGGEFSAGIGGGGAGIGRKTSGNIVISGGEVKATGGDQATGIGSGGGVEVGDILISGGEIEAYGGTYCPGIGSSSGFGFESGTTICGNIMVSPGVVSVKAVAGTGTFPDPLNPIGPGPDGASCGSVVQPSQLWAQGYEDSLHRDSTEDINERTIVPRPWNGNLATLNFNAVVTNGMTIYGTLARSYKVSIAVGASIWLEDAYINEQGNMNGTWAGITCCGDALITLEGSSIIKGFGEGYAGIYYPEGSTLEIDGDGRLDAICSSQAPVRRGAKGLLASGNGGGGGAGIGGNFGEPCGDLVISSGTINASGGPGAAGIGSASAGTSGTITILGGNISATGGEGAAGIGGGDAGSECGDITISCATVIATSGANATPIGAGEGGDPVNVTLEGVDDTTSGSTRIIVPRVGEDLGALTDDLLLTDGMTICGTLSGNYKVSIADGATVTLSDATITNGVNGAAGITCEGDATIILSGANTIKAVAENYPGIHVPEGHTLTIKGPGSLDVRGKWGAGIGGGYNIPCGNIVILGGTITAQGGNWAAGIGCGHNTGTGSDNRSRCGTISILGGNVTAIGGTYASGIGAGRQDTSSHIYTCCGDIVIAPGVTVIATKGSNGGLPISTGSAIGYGTLTMPTTDDGMINTVADGTRTIRPREWDGNLASLTRTAIATDGMTIYNTLGGNYKVSIAPGATVTLSNANINVDGGSKPDCQWAGLTCLGDATINLAGANFVRQFNGAFPAIHVPSGMTLNIRGTGELDAGSAIANESGAGIGGGYQLSCGNIVIDGGTITARGCEGGAGIGSGYGNSTCGDIMILGGTVNAIGGFVASGIGSGGGNSDCGDITIGVGVTRVTATCGDGCNNPIGAGDSSDCGDLTLARGLEDDDGSPTRIIQSAAVAAYSAWATANGITGAWDAVDANGVANVFRYAFDLPQDEIDDPPLLDITFDAQGKPVIKTPELVKSTGFTFSIVASDNVDGTGRSVTYVLNQSGETVVNEQSSGKRFFRLKVELGK